MEEVDRLCVVPAVIVHAFKSGQAGVELGHRDRGVRAAGSPTQDLLLLLELLCLLLLHFRHFRHPIVHISEINVRITTQVVVARDWLLPLRLGPIELLRQL